MNLRESYASTHHASLKWSPDHERAIDKVAASGRCDELGILLWKLKYMSESWALKKTREELIKRHLERFKHEVDTLRSLVIDQCLHEYLSDKCQWCKGAKEMIVNERRVVCDACQGHGIRKYSDVDRARYMKQSLGRVKTLQRQFTYIHETIGTLDRSVNQMMAYQLGRFE